LFTSIFLNSNESYFLYTNKNDNTSLNQNDTNNKGLNIHLVHIFVVFIQFGPYFRCVQLGPHFRQIVVNLVLFTNGV